MTGTGATALVDGCISPGEGVLGSLVRVLNTYYSAYDGTAGGTITAVIGGSITSLFGGVNKAAPRDYTDMTIRSVASVLDALVEIC